MKVAERIQLQELWQQRVSDWQQSGLTQTQWCHQHQLSPHQLSYWKRKLAKPGDKLIPLTVIQPEPVIPAPLTLHIGAVRIEANPAQAATLLRSCSRSFCGLQMAINRPCFLISFVT